MSTAKTTVHLSPAQYVIKIFKGVRATARTLELHPSTVSYWQTRERKRSQSGYIPSAIQKAILEKAKELGLDLTPEDLINGRTVEVEVPHE